MFVFFQNNGQHSNGIGGWPNNIFRVIVNIILACNANILSVTRCEHSLH